MLRPFVPGFSPTNGVYDQRSTEFAHVAWFCPFLSLFREKK